MAYSVCISHGCKFPWIDYLTVPDNLYARYFYVSYEHASYTEYMFALLIDKLHYTLFVVFNN